MSKDWEKMGAEGMGGMKMELYDLIEKNICYDRAALESLLAKARFLSGELDKKAASKIQEIFERSGILFFLNEFKEGNSSQLSNEGSFAISPDDMDFIKSNIPVLPSKKTSSLHVISVHSSSDDDLRGYNLFFDQDMNLSYWQALRGINFSVLGLEEGR